MPSVRGEQDMCRILKCLLTNDLLVVKEKKKTTSSWEITPWPTEQNEHHKQQEADEGT